MSSIFMDDIVLYQNRRYRVIWIHTDDNAMVFGSALRSAGNVGKINIQEINVDAWPKTVYSWEVELVEE